MVLWGIISTHGSCDLAHKTKTDSSSHSLTTDHSRRWFYLLLFHSSRQSLLDRLPPFPRLWLEVLECQAGSDVKFIVRRFSWRTFLPWRPKWSHTSTTDNTAIRRGTDFVEILLHQLLTSKNWNKKWKRKEWLTQTENHSHGYVCIDKVKASSEYWHQALHCTVSGQTSKFGSLLKVCDPLQSSQCRDRIRVSCHIYPVLVFRYITTVSIQWNTRP